MYIFLIFALDSSVADHLSSKQKTCTVGQHYYIWPKSQHFVFGIYMAILKEHTLVVIMLFSLHFYLSSKRFYSFSKLIFGNIVHYLKSVRLSSLNMYWLDKCINKQDRIIAMQSYTFFWTREHYLVNINKWFIFKQFFRFLGGYFLSYF